MVERRMRKRRPRFLFLKIILILILIGSLSAAFIVNFCQTKEVKVKGNKLAGEEEIVEAALSDKYDTNAVYATVRNVFMKHATIPFVDHYTVSMKNLNTVMISVKEKELYGYLKNDKGDRFVYYSADGTVLEVSERHIKGTFFVNGLTVKNAKAGEPLPLEESDTKTILAIQNEIQREKLKVKKIRFSQDGMITFKVKKVLVNLGTRTAVTEKVRRLHYILPKLKGMKGTLHLEEWSEENTDIVFEKASKKG